VEILRRDVPRREDAWLGVKYVTVAPGQASGSAGCGPDNTKISGEAPFGPRFVRCILLLDRAQFNQMPIV